jgi:hypothetical protein
MRGRASRRTFALEREPRSLAMSATRKTAVATLLAFALAAPPVTARPILDPPLQKDISAPPRVIVRADSGFDWASAGIGAATGALAVAAAGGVALTRRARLAP